jgi:hypothetical protein
MSSVAKLCIFYHPVKNDCLHCSAFCTKASGKRLEERKWEKPEQITGESFSKCRLVPYDWGEAPESAVPTSSQVMLDSCCLWDSPHTPKPGIELRAVHMLITSPTTELHPSPLWDTLNRKRCGNSDIAQAFHCREKERTGGHTEVTANHLMILRMKVGLIFWEFLPHSRPYFQLLPGKKGPFLF